jgi:hypothetical protein
MFFSNRRIFRLRKNARVMKISSEQSFYVEESCDLRRRINIIEIFVMI